MKKPNIIFILSDDLGPWALGCAGNEEIITPNIDRLANEGMYFENFHCASPVCSPARATLLTGKIPSAHGVHDWIDHREGTYNPVEFLEKHIGYTDILKENGYTNGLSGKWHLGNSLKVQKSFDHWYCHLTGGGPYYDVPMVKDGEVTVEKGYITDLITDDAIGFIKGTQDPFYLSVHYTAPHSPWLNNHPQEYLEMYGDCAFKTCPMEEEHEDAIELTRQVKEDLRGNLMGYFAAVTAMDHNIGRILDTLDELRIREDTLIIFSSDNGFSCGHHGFWGKGNGTFPLNLYDNSIKVPFILSHRGHIKENTRTDAIVGAYDFFPTLLDYLDMEYSKELLPGKSFAPLLKGKDLERDNFAVVFDEYGPIRMIRRDNYKYVKRYPYGKNELYDLDADPGEKNNLINNPSFSIMIGELNHILEDWFEKYGVRELDGSKLPVYGSGQNDMVSSRKNPHDIFPLADYIKEQIKRT